MTAGRISKITERDVDFWVLLYNAGFSTAEIAGYDRRYTRRTINSYLEKRSDVRIRDTSEAILIKAIPKPVLYYL